MNNEYLSFCAIISGILFGVWPLLINKSGLDPISSAFIFELSALVLVTIFGGWKGLTFANTNWWWGVIAGAVGGIGILVFTPTISKLEPEKAARMFIIMLLVQTAVPAIYQIFMGGINYTKIIGIVLAIVAMKCLA